MQRDAELSTTEEHSTVNVKQEPGEGTSRQSSSESGKATSSASGPPDDTTVISDAEDSDRGTRCL